MPFAIFVAVAILAHGPLIVLHELSRVKCTRLRNDLSGG